MYLTMDLQFSIIKTSSSGCPELPIRAIYRETKDFISNVLARIGAVLYVGKDSCRVFDIFFFLTPLHPRVN